MKKIIFLSFFSLLLYAALAQPDQDVRKMQETARDFMKQGDYDNALFVLNKALSIAPEDIDLLKDKAFVSYLKRDYAGAIDLGKKITSSPNADVQSFQILGLAYKAIADNKNGEKMYKEALQKFPESGILYSEYGDLLSGEKNGANAIKLWEKGIEVDPNQSSNYYYAASYYATTGNYIWSVIYGELFVNIESLSQRTKEIKQTLLEDYKKMYAGDYFEKALKAAGTFEKAVLDNYQQMAKITDYGITPETLTAIRTRFILNWFNTGDGKKFPFKLFEWQRTLLQEGYYNAYNQWLFGEDDQYTTWMASNKEEAQTFQQYQRNVLFKPLKGQYYLH